MWFSDTTCFGLAAPLVFALTLVLQQHRFPPGSLQPVFLSLAMYTQSAFRGIFSAQHPLISFPSPKNATLQPVEMKTVTLVLTFLRGSSTSLFGQVARLSSFPCLQNANVVNRLHQGLVSTSCLALSSRTPCADHRPCSVLQPSVQFVTPCGSHFPL